MAGLALGVDQTCERVMDALDERRCAWVVGDIGSGRSTLARTLVRTLDRAVWVDLLELDEADAIIGGLFGAVAHVDDEEARRSILKDWSSMQEATRELAAKAGDELTVVATVPRTWSMEAAVHDEPWQNALAHRARAFLQGLTSARLRVVVITTRDTRPVELGRDGLETIPLARPKNTRALLRSVDWGDYEQAAQALDAALPEELEPSPIHLRLAVGAVALDATAPSIARDLERPRGEALRAISDDIVDRLSLERHDELRRSIVRQLLARRPIPRGQVEALTGVPSGHRAFVTECLGYGDDDIRVSPDIRRRFGRLLARQSDEDAELHETTHRRLAEYYETLDGAANIASTFGAATTAWLEKTHHRAHLEPATEDDLPAREMYWARGRELSIHRKRPDAAAAVYEKCVAKFDDDAYAWHYLAVNLERAGKDRKRAEQAYRRAIELESSNPWWNSRLTTFLIGQGRPRAARTAWREALDCVDPDGERVAESAWLGEHFHRWACRAWLEVGSVSDAFEILQGIPDEVVQASEKLRELEQDVVDAVEAEALGGSVYPESYPIADRWNVSDPLPAERDGRTLEKWFPGRISSVTDAHVEVFYGTRRNGADDAEREAEYEARLSRIPRGEWSRIASLGPQRDAFVVLGIYGRGTQWIVQQRSERAPEKHERPSSSPLLLRPMALPAVAPLAELEKLDPGYLYVFAIGPGQGEAIAIALPRLGWVVMDGCRAPRQRSRDPFPVGRILERYWRDDDELRLVLLTHPHRDHAHGVADLLEERAPRHVALTGVDDASSVRRTLADEAALCEQRRKEATKGESLVAGSVLLALRAIELWAESHPEQLLALHDGVRTSIAPPEGQPRRYDRGNAPRYRALAVATTRHVRRARRKPVCSLRGRLARGRALPAGAPLHRPGP